uniref:TGF_beta domain-containing protein n=3 Tax=Thalassocalyce inconstans TaxID=140487 RepID=V9PPU6_THAIN|nr:TGF_beta domain-containing protein [Thalassocalyce inconstans]
MVVWLVLLLYYSLSHVLGTEEQELFNRLGIPEPPRVPSGRKSDPPSFMMELFKQRSRVLGRGMATSISSFDALDTSQNHEVSEDRWRFAFSISDLEPRETVTEAHMRIYKVKGSKQKETPYRVNMFHVLERERSLKSSVSQYYLISPFNSSLVVRLLDSQILESRQSHWVSFDVAEALRALHELGVQRAMFEIVCTPLNPIDVAASSRGIRFTKSRGKQPSLIVFSDDGRNDVEEDRDTRNSATLDDTPYDPSQKHCQRKELYIDFGRLGWSWIIGPPGFDAFMCSGECALTFNNKLQITNHAYLQAFLESKHKNVPKPCCSPMKLSPMTLIYYTENGVKMKEYEQMRVEQCGCE